MDNHNILKLPNIIHKYFHHIMQLEWKTSSGYWAQPFNNYFSGLSLMPHQCANKSQIGRVYCYYLPDFLISLLKLGDTRDRDRAKCTTCHDNVSMVTGRGSSACSVTPPGGRWWNLFIYEICFGVSTLHSLSMFSNVKLPKCDFLKW